MAKVEYRISDEMPRDMPVLIVDSGDRVTITLNPTHDLETLIEGLNVAVNQYIASHWVHLPDVVTDTLDR